MLVHFSNTEDCMLKEELAKEQQNGENVIRINKSNLI